MPGSATFVDRVGRLAPLLGVGAKDSPIQPKGMLNRGRSSHVPKVRGNATAHDRARRSTMHSKEVSSKTGSAPSTIKGRLLGLRLLSGFLSIQ